MSLHQEYWDPDPKDGVLAAAAPEWQQRDEVDFVLTGETADWIQLPLQEKREELLPGELQADGRLAGSREEGAVSFFLLQLSVHLQHPRLTDPTGPHITKQRVKNV